MVDNGELNVITGCMFSGKTKALLSQLEHREEYNDSETILFTPRLGSSYVNREVRSDDERVRREAVTVNLLQEDVPDDHPAQEGAEEILVHTTDEDVVGIDGAHFFGEEIVSVCEKLAEDGKTVIVSGLDQNFKREPFGHMPELMVAADEVMKLHTECAVCGEKATTTQKLVEGEPAKEESPVIAVGTDMYEPRCRRCHKMPEE